VEKIYEKGFPEIAVIKPPRVLYPLEAAIFLNKPLLVLWSPSEGRIKIEGRRR
jgi:hypothetical protein